MSELRLYRPSSGSEGEDFFCRFCYRCERDRAYQEGEPGAEPCDILSRALAFVAASPDYPRDWHYDEAGEPVCSAFLPTGSQCPTDAQLEAAGQQVLL